MNPPGFEEFSSRVEMVTLSLVGLGCPLIEASGTGWVLGVESLGAGLRS
jgi:hypothetical protein